MGALGGENVVNQINDQLLPNTIVIFRAKKLKPRHTDNKADRIPASYHAAYKIKLLSDFAKAVCGKFVYIDWNTPFEIINYDEIKEGSILFVEENKSKGVINRDITDHMCQKCLSELNRHHVID